MRKRFKLWEQEFRQGRLGKAALQNAKSKLEKHAPALYFKFERDILLACYQAQNFSAELDKAESYRRRERKLKQGQAYQRIEEIERLQKFAKAYSTELSRTLQKNLPNKTFSIKSVDDIDAFCIDFCVLLEGLIEGDNANNLSFAENHVFGNLKYKEVIDNKGNYKRASSATMLMFELAIYFRLWTSPNLDYQKECEQRGSGLRMPKTGSPSHALIALLMNAVFPEGEYSSYSHEFKSFEADKVKFRLKDIPEGTLLIEWDFT